MKKWKKIKIMSFLAATCMLLSAVPLSANDRTPEDLVAEAKAQAGHVSVHELRKMIDSGEKMIILDVSEEKEFEKKHIAGAMHISRGVLEFMVLDKIPDKHTRIIVY